jgi:hypothetical protein
MTMGSFKHWTFHAWILNNSSGWCWCHDSRRWRLAWSCSWWSLFKSTGWILDALSRDNLQIETNPAQQEPLVLSS